MRLKKPKLSLVPKSPMPVAQGDDVAPGSSVPQAPKELNNSQAITTGKDEHASQYQTEQSRHSKIDRSKIEQLYNTYRPGLFNYLVNICPGGQEEALEILHETYIRLLRLDNLSHLEQSPRAYIFTIATNLSRDAMRRRASRKLDVHDEFDELEFTSQEPTPTEVMDWNQSLEKLKKTLVNLPELTKNIFLLSRFDEMSYPQIAQHLNLSTRTVERHMSNAMKVLQKSFEDIL